MYPMISVSNPIYMHNKEFWFMNGTTDVIAGHVMRVDVQQPLMQSMQNRLLTYTWPAVESSNITVITEALSKSPAARSVDIRNTKITH